MKFQVITPSGHSWGWCEAPTIPRIGEELLGSNGDAFTVTRVQYAFTGFRKDDSTAWDFDHVLVYVDATP